MRWLWKLITAELEVTLALLMLLGSMVVLSGVYANTADINVSLTVLEETEEENGDGGSGSGGSGGSGISLPIPSTSTSPVLTMPLPEKPKPPEEFKLVDYVPKVIPVHRDALIVLYGYGFPSDFKIVIKAKDAMLVADSAMVNKKTAIIEGAVLEAVQYVIPAKTLSPGEAVLVIQEANQVLTPPLRILVYDPAQAIKLRAQIAQRTINITVASGQSANVAVKFKNIGLTEWDYLLQPLHIGTDQPRDRQSRFVHQDWPYNNRVAKISLPTNINTGESFDAIFSIQAPVVKRTTRYTENFALVAEGIAWISGSNFTVRITVTAPVAIKTVRSIIKTTPPAPAIKKPAAPYKTPGAIPTTGGQSGVWLNGIKSFFTRLFSFLIITPR